MDNPTIIPTTATHGDLPCVNVPCKAGRSVVREFDYTKDGKQVHVKRQALQIMFVDAFGYDNVGVCVPVWGWEVDVSKYARMPLNLYVTQMELDQSGVCVFRICGLEPIKVGK